MRWRTANNRRRSQQLYYGRRYEEAREAFSAELDRLDKQFAAFEAEVSARLHPYQRDILKTIMTPGFELSLFGLMGEPQRFGKSVTGIDLGGPDRSAYVHMIRGHKGEFIIVDEVVGEPLWPKEGEPRGHVGKMRDYLAQMRNAEAQDISCGLCGNLLGECTCL